MTDELIKHVSDTAFWVAHYRWLETERPDALFRDPLAGLLAGEHGARIAAKMPAMTQWVVVMRTCIIDSYIQRAVADGVDLILNLGAGLDTRPYRMDLPSSLQWIEVDYPHVIVFKEKQLSGEKPRCRLERVRLDLADVGERRKFFGGLNARAEKVMVLTEGLVPYLSGEEAGSLAQGLRATAVVRSWVVDYFSPRMAHYRRRRGMARRLRNAPFKFEPQDWFGFFETHGWRRKEIRYFSEEAERVKRPIPLPGLMKMSMRLWTLFLSERRRRALREFAGYVLLEPL